jgi:hypothetical protein
MTLLFSPHSTQPHLYTADSMDLVCFWPLPTSMARRERQRSASGVWWWVGTVRLCVQKKVWIYCHDDDDDDAK